MKHLLDVCAGIGGFSLAFKYLIGGFRTVGYIEIDPYCQEVLRQRIRDGILDDAPIFSDLREFDGRPYRGKVDYLSAGFPCQPFSAAGKRKGKDDDRNLWPYLRRLVRNMEPDAIFLENVPTILTASGYLGNIFGDLAEGGYDLRWDCIPASAVGANHRRDRVWILAHSQKFSERPRLCAGKPSEIGWRRSGNSNSQDWWWSSEPDVGRVAHGVPSRVDRLKSLGNGIVPAVAAKAWEMLNQ